MNFERRAKFEKLRVMQGAFIGNSCTYAQSMTSANGTVRVMSAKIRPGGVFTRERT